jgi:hypothetical protein
MFRQMFYLRQRKCVATHSTFRCELKVRAYLVLFALLAISPIRRKSLLLHFVLFAGPVVCGATAHAQNIFVTEDGTFNVSEWTLSGSSVNTYFTPTDGDPTGIAVSGSNLYYAGHEADVISTYSLSAGTTNFDFITGLNGPTFLAISGSDIFVANGTGNTIGEYTTSGGTVNASLIAGLNRPTGLAVSGSDVFVASYNTGTIGEYTTSGGTINPSLVNGLNSPLGLAVSGSDIFVVNNDFRIGEYTTSGGTVNASLITALPYQSFGLALSGTDLYLVNGDYIGEYTTSGGTVNPTLIGDPNEAFGVAVSSAAPTPEPGTLALVSAAALSLLGYGWRRHRVAKHFAKLTAFDQEGREKVRTRHLLSPLLLVLAVGSTVNGQVFTFSSSGGSQVFTVSGSGSSGSIQTYTIPATGTYDISVSGAQGGLGGLGASVSGDVSLTQGTVLDIVVGQQGLHVLDNVVGGGGGGSFVYVAGASQPLAVAGGGGGGSYNSTSGWAGQNATSGNAGYDPSSGGYGGFGGTGGAGGGGGTYSYVEDPAEGFNGGGGGGWLAVGHNGANEYSGNGGFWRNGLTSFGGGAGNSFANGGFGDGGGGGAEGGGGGGGYSGGGGGSGDGGTGGGGGSYLASSFTNTLETAGYNSGNGEVSISPVSATPEPGTLALAAIGLSTGAACFGWKRRRRRWAARTLKPSAFDQQDPPIQSFPSRSSAKAA